MRISAKADYAVRAAAELAASAGERPVKGEALATAQGIPQNFLENILADLRHAGLVKSQRGADGGYRLAKPAAEVIVADVIRAVEGPLAAVRGEAPEDVTYSGAAAPLQDVWIAVRANLRAVVEHVSLADLAAGHRLARAVARLAQDVDVVRAHEPVGQVAHRPEELHDEAVGRVVVELARRADLLDTALVEHGDAVGDPHRLLLVVRDQHGRD